MPQLWPAASSASQIGKSGNLTKVPSVNDSRYNAGQCLWQRSEKHEQNKKSKVIFVPTVENLLFANRNVRNVGVQKRFDFINFR